jgi:sugar lactone lactonase YvrE
VIAGVGFLNSESARYDDQADDYLVSNLGERGPTNNGFISRVGPDGKVKTLKWIEGGRDGAMLVDPLGIYPKGDRLYVADPTAVRIFDRKTGAYHGSIEMPAGAERLNDLIVADDGTIYVTDSRMPNNPAPGVLYRISPQGEASVFVASSVQLGNPNGIALAADGSVVHGGRGDKLSWRDPTTGALLRERVLPTGRFDGIVLLTDGSLLVASQDGHNVYHLASDGGAPTVVAKDITVPAAIGYDHKRKRLLVPQIAAGSVTFYDIGK